MDLKLLHQTCEFFGLGDPLEIEPVTQGLANRNFIVTTGKGQYVVKDALIHTPQEIEQEIAYLERLKLHEFPAPLYLKSVNGSYFYCPDGHTFVVQEKVTGEHPQADPQVCREVGSALARLHQRPITGDSQVLEYAADITGTGNRAVEVNSAGNVALDELAVAVSQEFP